MLKLNASFMKKLPAESSYSSQSYHASIEVELPDGLSEPQLREKIHSTFALVRASVESEIVFAAAMQAQSGDASRRSQENAQRHVDPASLRQLRYLLDLGRQYGVTPAELAAKGGTRSVDELTRQQCSKLIDELGRKAA